MLIPFKQIPETREGFPCLAFRWTFQLTKDFVGFVHQAQNANGEWHDSHTVVYGLSYHGKWMWGADHIYYDGPHCFFAAGPFRIQWHNDGCKKCYHED